MLQPKCPGIKLLVSETRYLRQARIAGDREWHEGAHKAG